MKRGVAFIAILLGSPVMLTAQNSQPAPGGTTNSITVTMTSPEGSKAVTIPVNAFRTCPVSMEAKQGSGGGLVMVRKAQPDPQSKEEQSFRPAGNIHLILKRSSYLSNFDQISSATVTARGLSARSRIDRTPATVGSDRSDLRRTLNVTFTSEADGSFSADLDLPGFTSVQSIRIDSIALKDGSTWTFDTKEACVVTPDPLMLIANQ